MAIFLILCIPGTIVALTLGLCVDVYSFLYVLFLKRTVPSNHVLTDVKLPRQDLCASVTILPALLVRFHFNVLTDCSKLKGFICQIVLLTAVYQVELF